MESLSSLWISDGHGVAQRGCGCPVLTAVWAVPDKEQGKESFYSPPTQKQGENALSDIGKGFSEHSLTRTPPDNNP